VICRGSKFKISFREAARRACFLVFLLLGAFSIRAQPGGPTKIIRIAAGKSADVWLGVNVKGKVFYSIRTRDKTNAARMWWIMFPLGTVKQLGNLRGSGSLPIPNLLNASASAKLRASATSDTVIYVNDTAAVSNSVTFSWP
jgi:hypothetical protein